MPDWFWNLLIMYGVLWVAGYLIIGITNDLGDEDGRWGE